MSSTYLDLTNRVLRRLNQVELTASDFASARGIHAMAKDAVLDTVRKINSQKFEWPFNFAAGSQVLNISQERYTFPTDLRAIDWQSFFITKDDTLGVGTKRLQLISKDEWMKYFREIDVDSDVGIGVPAYVFHASNDAFGVTPSPDAAYTVTFNYFINTITLSAYGDTCTIPTEYDYVIVDGALNYMYMFLDNDSRAKSAEVDFNRGLQYMTQILIPQDPYMYTAVVDRVPFNTGYYSNGG